MILIEMVVSSSCRGWEGNECEVFEYDGTLREFIMEEFDLDEERVQELDDCGWDEEDLGFRGMVEDESVDYEGDESTVSIKVLKVNKEYVEMLSRHIKE